MQYECERHYTSCDHEFVSCSNSSSQCTKCGTMWGGQAETATTSWAATKAAYLIAKAEAPDSPVFCLTPGCNNGHSCWNMGQCTTYADACRYHNDVKTFGEEAANRRFAEREAKLKRQRE